MYLSSVLPRSSTRDPAGWLIRIAAVPQDSHGVQGAPPAFPARADAMRRLKGGPTMYIVGPPLNRRIVLPGFLQRTSARIMFDSARLSELPDGTVNFTWTSRQVPRSDIYIIVCWNVPVPPGRGDGNNAVGLPEKRTRYWTNLDLNIISYNM